MRLLTNSPSSQSLSSSIPFLDRQAFGSTSQSGPKMNFDLVPLLMRSLEDAHAIATNYFQKIHWWMPIVSRNCVFESISTSFVQQRPATALLLQAMEVLLWHPAQQSLDPITPAYLTVKHAITEANAIGVLELQLLQAQILICIYELGHAMFPAVYSSIAACAQYGYALGVDEALRPDYGGNHLPLEAINKEECRRAWWAILILDRYKMKQVLSELGLMAFRYMKLGNHQRHLSTEDPLSDSILPCDDDEFDRGVL
jgi:hypothetical protein